MTTNKTPSFSEAVKARIATWRGKIDDVLNEGHVIACDIVAHTIEHGDCSAAQWLINAMPKATDRVAMKNWFDEFTPIVTKLSDDWNAKMHKPDSKLYRPFRLEEAKATPWYLFSKDREERSYDFNALMEMVSRLGKTIQKKIDGGKVLPEDKLSAEAIVTAISGLKVAKVSVVEAPKAEASANDEAEANEAPMPGVTLAA